MWEACIVLQDIKDWYRILKILFFFFSGLNELIEDNSDYLVDSISLRLRHLERYPRSPDVLKVVLKYTSPEIIPLLRETINEVVHI